MYMIYTHVLDRCKGMEINLPSVRLLCTIIILYILTMVLYLSTCKTRTTMNCSTANNYDINDIATVIFAMWHKLSQTSKYLQKKPLAWT